MSAFAAIFGLLAVISSGFSEPEKERRTIRPEYLDMLLENKQYALFAKIMDIPDVNLVRPNEGERNENPMFHKALKLGDILPARGEPLKEESRQGMRFDRYPSYKWTNNAIPYYISSQFSSSQTRTIERGIRSWNNQVSCLKLTPYNGEKDYVYVFNGDGCWSYMGRIGGEQSLSLQRNGCVSRGTVLHEFEHAAGIDHEQNRLDRDDFIEILWNNIPEDWKSQYEKVDSRYYSTQSNYDYYSIMHYTVEAPDTNKDAFRVRRNGIDKNRIGNGDDFTQTDIDKINILYC